ncbi:post-transcriptional regulator [Halobacillus yeomjeoni]|uniref:Post-transcriptional regulator n=1 Tax=Halobacillus yeomjeoni TaxID=311194 RepID=A0A931HUK3_9BACI|nr:post-transcriptional regulator [Halobacillus yeomjeoni]MBH0229987.1 post-transcriptional regulator [Halobacillus yeomjeoni]MCA0982635.1 post-transcriptional regulator [Halobacillus yeomjeoni]
MEVVKTVSQWKDEVAPVLESKLDELHLLGYNRATKNEVWECLVQKVWKGNPEKRIHEVVQDIFHLNIHTYVSYLTMSAFQNEDLMASLEALNVAPDQS